MEHLMAVVCAVVLSYAGSYLLVSLIEQYRLCILSKVAFLHRKLILLLAASALSGMTCFAAFILELVRHDPNVRLNVPITIVALFVALSSAYLSMYVSTFDRVFSKDKQELFTMIMNDMQHVSIAHIRKHHAILKTALFKGSALIVAGGGILGTGLWFMQCCLLGARLGSNEVIFDPLIVFAAYSTSVITCSLCYVILFRVISLYPNYEALRTLCAVLLSCGLLGSHRIMLSSIEYKVHSTADETTGGVGSDTMTLLVLGGSMLLVCIVNQMQLTDLRKRLHWCTRVVAAHSMRLQDSTEKSVIAELHRSIRQYPLEPQAKERKHQHVKVRPMKSEQVNFAVMEEEEEEHDEEKSSTRFRLLTATMSADERDNLGVNEV